MNVNIDLKLRIYVTRHCFEEQTGYVTRHCFEEQVCYVTRHCFEEQACYVTRHCFEEQSGYVTFSSKVVLHRVLKSEFIDQ